MEAMEQAKRYDGKYLLYNRKTQRLTFEADPRDTRVYLTIGMVWGGQVGGHTVAYWLDKIEEDKRNEVSKGT